MSGKITDLITDYEQGMVMLDTLDEETLVQMALQGKGQTAKDISQHLTKHSGYRDKDSCQDMTEAQMKSMIERTPKSAGGPGTTSPGFQLYWKVLYSYSHLTNCYQRKLDQGGQADLTDELARLRQENQALRERIQSLEAQTETIVLSQRTSNKARLALTVEESVKAEWIGFLKAFPADCASILSSEALRRYMDAVDQGRLQFLFQPKKRN